MLYDKLLLKINIVTKLKKSYTSKSVTQLILKVNLSTKVSILHSSGHEASLRAPNFDIR
jgi:hypothetical protein